MPKPGKPKFYAAAHESQKGADSVDDDLSTLCAELSVERLDDMMKKDMYVRLGVLVESAAQRFESGMIRLAKIDRETSKKRTAIESEETEGSTETDYSIFTSEHACQFGPHAFLSEWDIHPMTPQSHLPASITDLDHEKHPNLALLLRMAYVSQVPPRTARCSGRLPQFRTSSDPFGIDDKCPLTQRRIVACLVIKIRWALECLSACTNISDASISLLWCVSMFPEGMLMVMFEEDEVHVLRKAATRASVLKDSLPPLESWTSPIGADSLLVHCADIAKFMAETQPPVKGVPPALEAVRGSILQLTDHWILDPAPWRYAHVIGAIIYATEIRPQVMPIEFAISMMRSITASTVGNIFHQWIPELSPFGPASAME